MLCSHTHRTKITRRRAKRTVQCATLVSACVQTPKLTARTRGASSSSHVHHTSTHNSMSAQAEPMVQETADRDGTTPEKERECALETSVRACLAGAPASWCAAPAPEMPSGFQREAFQLPKHRTRLLEMQNGFQRDARIRFDEEPHIYYVDGIATSWSVTGLVHKFCEEFDATRAIASMRKGKRWPREEYATACTERLRQAARMMVATLDQEHPCGAALRREEIDRGHVIAALCALNRGDHALPAAATGARAALTEAVAAVADTDAEIRQKWDDNRDEAANRGTWMHLQCELWLNRDGCHLEGPEMAMFRRYCRERLAPLHVRAYRTEPEVFADDLDLAGSIDFVGVITDGPDKGAYMVVDWKRTKQLRTKSRHMMGRTMKPPLDDVPDAGRWHYVLQLNIYAFILERYYGLRVARLEVACFHPDNGDEPYYFEVPRLPEVTACMVAYQQAQCAPKVVERAAKRLRQTVLPSI